MKIGFFGGTLNPPHNGHLNLARQWYGRLELDRFFLVPTGCSPHKQDAGVPGDVRLEMCRLAAADSGGMLEACDLEVRRGGRSYSVLTLAELHALYPGSEIYMVMGADMFVSLETWYDFPRLRTLATFCTMPRGEYTYNALERHRQHLAEVGCRGLVADVPAIDISSTEIRARVRDGLPIDDLVPPGVAAYIRHHGLYRDGTATESTARKG